jgi:hypothetical protein
MAMRKTGRNHEFLDTRPAVDKALTRPYFSAAMLSQMARLRPRLKRRPHGVCRVGDPQAPDAKPKGRVF